jgi:hypothetical protein
MNYHNIYKVLSAAKHSPVVKRARGEFDALIAKERRKTVRPKRAVQQRKRAIADMYPDHPHINDGI